RCPRCARACASRRVTLRSCARASLRPASRCPAARSLSMFRTPRRDDRSDWRVSPDHAAVHATKVLGTAIYGMSFTRMKTMQINRLAGQTTVLAALTLTGMSVSAQQAADIDFVSVGRAAPLEHDINKLEWTGATISRDGRF